MCLLRNFLNPFLSRGGGRTYYHNDINYLQDFVTGEIICLPSYNILEQQRRNPQIDWVLVPRPRQLTHSEPEKSRVKLTEPKNTLNSTFTLLRNCTRKYIDACDFSS